MPLARFDPAPLPVAATRVPAPAGIVAADSGTDARTDSGHARKDRQMPTKIAQAKTPAQRKQVAQQVLRLRKAGTPWDGPNGIVAQGFVSGAPQGRQLLRTFNL